MKQFSIHHYFLAFLALCSFLLNTTPINAQTTKRIYLTGNSITDALKYSGFKALAESRGNTHIWGRHMIPGAPIHYFFDDPTGGVNQPPYGYFTTALRDYTWDVLSVQPTDKHIEGELGDNYNIGRFLDYANDKSPNIQIFISTRWHRRPKEITSGTDPKLTAAYWNELWDRPYSGPNTWDGTVHTGDYYQKLLHAARNTHTSGPPVIMVPIGEVYRAMNNKMAAGLVPGYTNIWQVYTDHSHVNGLGSYIAAVTYYATLYKDNPIGLGVPTEYGTISPEVAKIVQETAWQVVTSEPYTNVTDAGGEPVPSLRSPERPENTVAGLNYSYFEGTWTVLPDFSTLKAAEEGTVTNFDLSPRNREDNFGFRFSGFIQVPTDGEYTFYTSSDDGSKLYIGSTTVVNNDGQHGLREASGKIGLKAGKHSFAVHYFDATGSQQLTVSYQGPGTSKKAIPSSALSSVPVDNTPNNPPTAVMTATPSSGTAPLKVSFRADGSSDPDEGDYILGYSWNFGDGNTSVFSAPDHTYTEPGTYTATLKVIDSHSLYSEPVTKQIVVNAPVTNPVVTKYEAESATISGGQIRSDHPGFSGTGFWAYVVSQGQSITFKVNSKNGGNSNITTRYANGTTSARLMSLYVNGTKVKQLNFPVTSTWSNWSNVVENVNLRAGENTVAIRFDAGDNGHVNIDYISVEEQGPDGKVVMEKWTGIPGREVSLIPVNTAPNTTTELTSLEIPVNTDDNYGARIRGYIIPSTTGTYTFYISSDDNGELWLSSNDQPSTKSRIAYVSTWTPSRYWNKEASQKSAPVSLTKGQRYYFEALMKDNTGGDNLAIGWTGPGISTITVISSDNISSYNAGTGSVQEPAGVSLSINPNNEYQTMDGFGFFGARDAWWSGSDPNHYFSDEWLDKIIGDLGITIWRNELYPHNPVDQNTTANQDAHWGKQKPMVQALKAKADQYGVDLKIILTVWSPPGEFKWWSEMQWAGDLNAKRGPSDKGDYWSEKNGGTLNPNKYVEYANWLIAGIQMYKDAGVDVYAISPQNEPAFSQFFNSTTYTTYWFRDMVKAVGPLVKAKHPEVKFFGAENMLQQEGADHNWEWFYHNTLIKDPAAMDVIDILAYHGYTDGVNASSGSDLADYWTNTRQIFAEPFNKKQWMTETSGYIDAWEGTTKPGAFGLALDIFSALKYGNISAWVWWQGSDLESSIMDEALMNGMSVGNKYNVSKHYYRFVRPDAVRVEAESNDADVFTLAFKNSGENSKTLIVLNTATTSKTINVSSFGNGWPTSYQMYVSSASQDFVSKGNISGTITLPPRSIVTLQAGGNTLQSQSMALSGNLKTTEEKKEVMLYPNPANDEVKIVLDAKGETKAAIEVRNLLNQVVIAEQVSLSQGKNGVQLNTSSLNEGMYIISIKQGNQKSESKLIIKR